MSIRATLEKNRERVHDAAARHGARNLRLIGSGARGEDKPESDIDLLVDWDPESSLLSHASLVIELEEILGRRVDIASDGWLKDGVRESLYSDAVPL